MCKVLIIGDSSVLPREELSLLKTFYSQIKSKMNIDIENSSVSNNNSYNIYTNLKAFMLHGYTPDTVILNYGIVDVFPRPYPNKIYRLLSCTGLLPQIDKILKKTKLYYKLGDLFNFKEVKLRNFKIYSEGIVQKLLDENVKKILIIGIIKPSKILLNSKTIKSEVISYNMVYKDLAQKYEEVHYIDIYNDTNEDFTIWDGYHYSEVASDYLAKQIEKLIRND